MYLSARMSSGSLSPRDFGCAGFSSTGSAFARLAFVAFDTGPSDSGLASSLSFASEVAFASSPLSLESVLLFFEEAAAATSGFESEALLGEVPSEEEDAFASLPSASASGGAAFASLEF